MTREEAKQRAAAGAAFLDKHDPDWWKSERIALPDLAMGNECACVLGQLYGIYYKAARILHLTFEDACGLGFHAPNDTAFDILTAAWRELIRARRQHATHATHEGGTP